MLKKTMLLGVLMLFAALLMGAAPPQVMLYQFGDGLNDYLAAADGEATYPVLIALDLAQGRDITRPDALELNKNAALLAGCGTQQEMLARVPYTLRQGVQDALGRLRYLQDVVENKRFPFFSSVSASYWNDWGQDRLFGGARSHEGIDLMADWGVPVYAVGDGVIEKAGWNTLGGWRIGVRGDSDGVYYYYAHLSSFYDGVAVGAQVKKGQLLGFVGDTGYGPVGTSGVMAPHLHFGMYEGDFMRAVNPYPMLRHWQKNS